MKVFVASTYREFARERATAIEAIRELAFQPISMEDFGASANAPIEVCVAAVSASQVMVVLLGTDYGSRIPDSDKSFTHAEIETAMEKQLPLLIYTRGLDPDLSHAAWPAPFRMLIASILEKSTASTYSSSRELRDLLALDLVRLAADHAPLEHSGFQGAKDAILKSDFKSARRLLFEAITSSPAEAYRLLSYVELLDKRPSDALSDAVAMLSRAAAAGDPRAAAALKALTACSPAWFDTS